MLKVWFYDPANDEEGMFNKAVSYSDPPFCHCELQFPNSMTCSIYMGSAVCFKERLCFGDAYTVLNIPSTHDQIKLAYQVCHRNFTAKKRFSTMEMLSCVSPWKQNYASKQSQYTFCSKLIAEALQAADILPGSLSTTISPSALYRALLPMADEKCNSQRVRAPMSSTTPIFDINFNVQSSNSNANVQVIPEVAPCSIVIDFRCDQHACFD